MCQLLPQQSDYQLIWQRKADEGLVPNTFKGIQNWLNIFVGQSESLFLVFLNQNYERFS